MGQAPKQLRGHRILVGFDETGDSTDEGWLAVNADGGLLATVPSNKRNHGLVERLSQVCRNWFRIVDHDPALMRQYWTQFWTQTPRHRIERGIIGHHDGAGKCLQFRTKHHPA